MAIDPDNLSLECIRLALVLHPTTPAEKIVEYAGKFRDFVRGGAFQSTDAISDAVEKERRRCLVIAKAWGNYNVTRRIEDPDEIADADEDA